MKKFLVLFLSVVMICSMFVACGKSNTKDDDVTSKPTNSTTNTAPDTTETKPVDTDAVTTEPTTEEKPDAPVVPNNQITLGIIQKNVYINDYVGFTCTFDGPWEFATSEELQELPNDVADILAGSNIPDNEILAQIFDLQAENTTELMSINIIYNKLSAIEVLAYAAKTEEQVLDEILEQKDSMIAAYAQAGIIVTTMEKVHVKFCEVDRVALLTTASINDVPYFTLQLFDYNLGAYSVTTTFASFGTNKTNDMLTMCSPIK